MVIGNVRVSNSFFFPKGVSVHLAVTNHYVGIRDEALNENE